MKTLEEAKHQFLAKIYELDKHLSTLQKLIQETGEELEGNCFYEHHTFTFRPELLMKQINLFWAGSESTKICEIGFNAGHSALLFFLGNPKLKSFVIFDVCTHKYVKPCLEYIATQFQDTEIEVHIGDSKVSVPNYLLRHTESFRSFDLVHVDGGHDEHCIKSDMIYADKLVCINGIIIIDDTDNSLISSYVDKYLATGRYKELNILETTGYKHRMIQKLSD